jgi:hypothetical protein
MKKPKRILEARNRVIQAQKEAATNLDHPINDGLKAHFEERKRKLLDIQKSKVK